MANEHPIKALGDTLLNSAKPPARETWTQFCERRGITPDSYRAMSIDEQRLVTETWLWASGIAPPLNINSLDENDPRGVDDVIDLDREREVRAGLHYEKPSGS